MSIQRDTQLVCADVVSILYHSSGDVTVFDGADATKLPSHALAILDAFRQARTLEEGLAGIRVTNGADFVALSHTALRLLELGALHTCDEAERNPTNWTADRWAEAEIHVRMLKDAARTDAFRRAIDARVSRGDVVVDIGTGTGILSTFASAAGASRVFAVEASSSMALAAQALVEAEGLGDRIEVIHGKSFSVDLPDRAHLLVTETVGNDPLAEHILEIVQDAKKRFLRSQPKIIPARIDVFGCICDLGQEFHEERCFTEANLRMFWEQYQVDFGPVAERMSQSSEIYLDVARARELRKLSEPVLIASIDLESDFSTHVERTVDVPIASTGNADGVMTFFSLDLGAGTHIVTNPEFAQATQHWKYPLYFKHPAEPVLAGDVVRLHYSHALGRSNVRLARRS